MPDSESAGQGGHFTLFFDQIGPVNQKLEKVSDLLNFHVRDMMMIDQFSHDERHWNTGKDATAGGSFIPLPDCLADRPSVPYSHGW